MASMDGGADSRALLAVKIVHTTAWAFFVLCIAAIPLMTWRGEYAAAAAFAGIVLLEVLVLASNRWRCPLTPVAARYTADRRANFDIFLPEWLARHNKTIFGALYAAGVLYLIAVAVFGVGAGREGPPGGPRSSSAVLSSWSNGLGMTLVAIPAGTFTMGSSTTDASFHDRPAHEVTISRPFSIATTEVTQAQWLAVMGTRPSRFAGDHRPVERVSWHDAREFIRRLNALEETNAYRLPSEAEWEYACRAGATEQPPSGLAALAWSAENSGGATHPVARKRANAWGLHDMLGNVYEWCGDWKGDYPSGSVVDPRGPDTGVGRVVRGGSWLVHANRVRPDFRDFLRPDERRDDVGFRVAADEGPR